MVSFNVINMALIIKRKELEEFCERWSNKANEYKLNSLSNYFDKFFTLYVIFTRIYNLIEALLKEQGELKVLKLQGKIKKSRNFTSDNEAATVCIAHYLRNESQEVVRKLQTHIEEYKNIINNELFFIDLYYGKPQPQNDKKLYIQLNSKENTIVLEGLLIILYKLRCNMFHAEKGFDREQEIILEPSIYVLAELNKILLMKIKQENL